MTKQGHLGHLFRGNGGLCSRKNLYASVQRSFIRKSRNTPDALLWVTGHRLWYLRTMEFYSASKTDHATDYKGVLRREKVQFQKVTVKNQFT